MTTATATRRLAAIFAADVVGYSRLMGADEEGTHERFKAYLRELVDPKIREHHGRIVKTTGDGVLVEFASVVDAVRCAGDVQRGMADRNLDLAEERRLGFVSVSMSVTSSSTATTSTVTASMSLHGWRDWRAGWHLRLGWYATISATDSLTPSRTWASRASRISLRPLRVYALRPEGTAGVSTARPSSATSRSPPIAAPRLSIVVLPFTNLSDDREQQYFADGITEDLTTDLSRIAHSFVISRNTAFTYRNKVVDTKQVGRELGVRYVLAGSVRRSGSRVRVSAQLIDAATDAHLWAEQFDRDTGDLFALQNEITGRLANALGVELIAAEAARPIEHPDALDYILAGVQHC